MRADKRVCVQCRRYYLVLRRAQRFCAPACRYLHHNTIRRAKLVRYEILVRRAKKTRDAKRLRRAVE